MMFFFFFFKQKTAYEMRISDWSSDVCSSDLQDCGHGSIRRRVRSLPLAQVPAPAAIGHAARRAEPRSGSEGVAVPMHRNILRSEEHTSELQSLMRISYAVFCLKKKKQTNNIS